MAASLTGVFSPAEGAGALTTGSRTTASGSLITVSAALWDGGVVASVSTPTDSKSNTYTELQDIDCQDGNVSSRLGFSYNIGGTRGASHTVSKADDGAGNSLGAHEWAGVASSPTVVSSSAVDNTGTSTAPTASVTVSAASLVVGAVIYDGSDTTIAAAGGGTLAQDVDTDNSDQEHSTYYKTGQTGTPSISATLGAGREWGVIIAGFTEDTGGGGGRTTKNTRSWPLGVEVGMGWRMATAAALAALAVVLVEAQGTICYVRDGGTATGTSGCSTNGGNWNTANAYDELSTAETNAPRGATIYVADGTYASVTLNTAQSGTSVITIKKAIESDHGTETGWDSTYGDGQATLGTLNVQTGYWTIDGQAGSLTRTDTAYGFRFDTCSDNSSWAELGGSGVTITQFNVSHVAMVRCVADHRGVAIWPHTQITAWTNSTISDSYFYRWQVAVECNGSNDCTGLVIERSVFDTAWSSAYAHGDTINANGARYDGVIIRHNLFIDGGSGQTGSISANNANIIDCVVHGNVFADISVSNGLITGTSGVGDLLNCTVAHNTIVGVTGGEWIDPEPESATSNTVKNNLLWNMSATIGSATNVTNDYNAYFQTTNTPSETNGQTGSTDPFTNSGADNYRLAAATNAGDATICSTYSTDMDGVTRGGDGTCDRGAYEYNAGGGTHPALPPFLRPGN